MRQEICIDRVPGETRVALVEDGVLSEIVIERTEARGITGNVYLGRVRNILPGMQAAFLDLGLERDGFLYVEDAGAPHPSRRADPDGEAPAGDEPPAPAPASPPAARDRIEDLVKEGQEIIVQVAKDPVARKGPRITTHVALPGRHLVFLPGIQHVGVSRRIEDAEERERLRAEVAGVVASLGAPGGFIVRTVAAGLSAADLAPDARALVESWDAIVRRRRGASAPRLLHQEAGAVERALRDMLRAGVEEVIVDSDELFDEVRGLVGGPGGQPAPAIRRHEGALPLFEARSLQLHLDRALRPRVWLKSGGHVVLEQTEALVAIDVNTGKFVGRAGLEETILRTNLEAVREIVRQIRLRDLGGIIVVDFIDMDKAADRGEVLQALEQEIKKDRARSRMLQISEFGLVEITRQRSRPSLERALCSVCSTCGGSGRVRSIETLRLDILREARRRPRPAGEERLAVRVHPDVAAALSVAIGALAAGIGIDPDRLVVVADPGMPLDHWSLQGPAPLPKPAPAG
jgi:ribonuclease G